MVILTPSALRKLQPQTWMAIVICLKYEPPIPGVVGSSPANCSVSKQSTLLLYCKPRKTSKVDEPIVLNSYVQHRNIHYEPSPVQANSESHSFEKQLTQILNLDFKSPVFQPSAFPNTL